MYDRLSFLCNSLGLFFVPMQAGALASFSRHNSGLLGENYELNRVWVSVVTSSEGLFGRFFVLVCLGIGCTVWYSKIRKPSRRYPELICPHTTTFLIWMIFLVFIPFIILFFQLPTFLLLVSPHLVMNNLLLRYRSQLADQFLSRVRRDGCFLSCCGYCS